MKKTSKKSSPPSTPSPASPYDDGLASHIVDLINATAAGESPWKLREFESFLRSTRGLAENEREILLVHLERVMRITQRSIMKKELSQFAVGNKDTVADIPGAVDRFGKPESKVLITQGTLPKTIPPQFPTGDLEAHFKKLQEAERNAMQRLQNSGMQNAYNKNYYTNNT